MGRPPTWHRQRLGTTSALTVLKSRGLLMVGPLEQVVKAQMIDRGAASTLTHTTQWMRWTMKTTRRRGMEATKMTTKLIKWILTT